MSSSASPLTLAAGDGEFRWGMDGSLSRFIVPGSLTGETYALVEDTVTGGDGIPLHRHPDDDETFYVLEGEITFYLGDRPPFHASAGAVIFIPGELAHAFQPTSQTARYLIFTTPRHAEFYRAISRPAVTRRVPPSEPMDMEILAKTCEQFGVEILGPPPGVSHEDSQ